VKGGRWAKVQAYPKMPEELKALIMKGQRVRDRLGQLADEATKISAEAQKVLVRPEGESRGGAGQEELEGVKKGAKPEDEGGSMA